LSVLCGEVKSINVTADEVLRCVRRGADDRRQARGRRREDDGAAIINGGTVFVGDSPSLERLALDGEPQEVKARSAAEGVSRRLASECSWGGVWVGSLLAAFIRLDSGVGACLKGCGAERRGNGGGPVTSALWVGGKVYGLVGDG
jgi:hypothetical protein